MRRKHSSDLMLRTHLCVLRGFVSFVVSLSRFRSFRAFASRKSLPRSSSLRPHYHRLRSSVVARIDVVLPLNHDLGDQCLRANVTHLGDGPDEPDWLCLACSDAIDVVIDWDIPGTHAQ